MRKWRRDGIFIWFLLDLLGSMSWKFSGFEEGKAAAAAAEEEAAVGDESGERERERRCQREKR